MSEKQIASEEVEIISEVKTLFRGVNDTTHWYLSEREARDHAANANKCKTDGCANYAKRFYDRCDECRARIDGEKHQAELAAAPEWDGTYPVCIDDHFFSDEDELTEHLFENEIDPASLFELQACSEVFAKNTIQKRWLLEQVEQEMGEDGECPQQVEDMIDQFIANLATINTPICWIGDKLVRVTDEQRERLIKETYRAD